MMSNKDYNEYLKEYNKAIGKNEFCEANLIRFNDPYLIHRKSKEDKILHELNIKDKK